jgi:hypothetical protein
MYAMHHAMSNTDVYIFFTKMIKLDSGRDCKKGSPPYGPSVTG